MKKLLFYLWKLCHPPCHMYQRKHKRQYNYGKKHHPVETVQGCTAQHQSEDQQRKYQRYGLNDNVIHTLCLGF